MNLKGLSKKIVIILILLFSSTTMLFAQGPNAPEAASFEPVDATDMVNLLTGDFTYVLPLLNVPSPEGGYPLSLAYHAGIAMDQEASWVGLGWNLNPGAINRSVNGYPDDYNSSLLSEYFYDAGGTESYYSLSIGYSNGVSIGVGISWGSNRSFGGSVNIGFGIDAGNSRLGAGASIGTQGSSVGLGATFAGGLSLGINASSNGGFGTSLGFTNTNGSGFSISASNSGNFSLGFSKNNKNNNLMSLDVSFSSTGVGISGGVRNRNANFKTVGGAGVGLSLAFNNGVSMGDYTVKTSGYNIPLIIPTPVGVFSLSFGKQKMRYYLGKKEVNYIDGPLSFHDGVINHGKWQVSCFGEGSCDGATFITDSYQAALDYKNNIESTPGYYCQCTISSIGADKAFMDIYEIPIANYTIPNEINTENNNLTFPNYDKYNVQAQGLSGNMSSRIFENGALFGTSSKENDKGFKLNYIVNASNTPTFARFNQKPYFYFDNEISTYIDVNAANFNTNSTHLKITDYYDFGVDLNAKPRRKTSNFIEYFTNDEIISNYNSVKSKGYLKPYNSSSFDRSQKPKNSIGAFKITAADGKTYHYSLPVYNHEVITRSYGIIKDNNNNPKPENESYFEKRQLEPYVTHWLLTAVTGPDYVDINHDGIANNGDFGYWVNFSYGKWSDAYTWKNPYEKNFIESAEEAGVRTWVRGRKEVYYLNTVTTRTHTAIFVKSESENEKSKLWRYSAVIHKDGISSPYSIKFTIPTHNALKLDRIVLIKNDPSISISTHGINEIAKSKQTYVKYSNSSKSNELAKYNSFENVINNEDISNEILNKAIKIIDFNYNTIAPDSNTNNFKTSLKSVSFKGKSGAQLLPPYDFSYNDGSFNINDMNEWGYNSKDNSRWSLNEITTPLGGKINMTYEPHISKRIFSHKFEFTNYTEGLYKCSTPAFNSITDVSNKTIIIESATPLSNILGKSVFIRYNATYIPINGQCYKGNYNGSGTVTQNLGNNKYKVTFSGNVSIDPNPWNCNIAVIESELNPSYDRHLYHEKRLRSTKVTLTINNFDPIQGGGIRTSQIAVTNNNNENYITEYKYGENEDGIGYVSFLPFAQELEKTVPYSAELPSPRVMYEYVSTNSLDANGSSLGKTKYKFNVLKSKLNGIKFGDFYEITTEFTDNFTNLNADKEVNIAKYSVKDNLASIGQLLEVTSYNSENQVLNKTVNEYFSMNETPSNVGVTQEAYQSYKEVDYTDNSLKKDKWVINSTKRIKYPNQLKRTLRFSDNYKYETVFNVFNEITGQSDEVTTVDSKGNKLKSVNIPAYLKYPQMGTKVTNYANKNMLTQSTASYTYFLDKFTNNWNMIDAGITTWSNNWTYRDETGNQSSPTTSTEKIWRKHKNYIWKGHLNQDGTYQGYQPFNWTDISSLSHNWKKISEITRYSHFSTPLETMDINNNHTSTKVCDGNSKILSVTNSQYTEQFYSGAEYIASNASYFDGEIKSTGQNTVKAHTGTHSAKAASGQTAFEVTLKTGEHKADTYKISVWADKINYTNARIRINGVTKPFNGEIIPAGNWVQLNHYENLSAGSETIFLTSASGDIYYDDFRLLPRSSSMTSYVYNEWDELSYILGANNLASHFVYDEAGRLKETYTEVVDATGIVGGFKKISENDYHYATDIPNNNSGGGTTYSPLSATGLSPLIDSYFGTNLIYSSSLIGLTGGSGSFSYTWLRSINNGPFSIISTTCTTDCSYTIANYHYSILCNRPIKFRCKITDTVTGKSITVDSKNAIVNCSGNPK